MKTTLTLVIGIILFGAAPLLILANTSHRRPVVMVGDSITAWWQREGSGLLPSSVVVAGHARIGAVQYADEICAVVALSPRTAYIMLGTNDLREGWATPDEELAAIERIIAAVQATGARVIVQSVLPIADNPAIAKAAPSPALAAFNARLQALVIQRGAEYLDLWPHFADARGYMRPELTTDGLHLSRAGYQVWRAHIDH